MKKLKIILKSKKFYLILVLLAILSFINSNRKINIANKNEYIGIISNIYIDGNYLRLDLKSNIKKKKTK